MRFFYLIVLLTWINPLVAQSSAQDTLQEASQLHQRGELRLAEKLLVQWCANHPKDADAFWLRGQNDFWRKKNTASRANYERAIALDPKKLYLKLDYAEALLAMGKFHAADKLLHTISAKDTKDPHFQFVVAKQQFWLGNVEKASVLAKQAQQSGSTKAAALSSEVSLARSLWVELDGRYTYDTQPLESYRASLNAGLWYSKWLDLGLNSGWHYFSNTSPGQYATNISLSNKVRFPLTRTEIGVSAGVFQLKNQATRATGSVEIKQSLPLGFSLGVSSAVKPYLYTLRSLDTSIFYQQSSAELEWKPALGVWAKIGAQLDRFKDDNQITTLWGWAMSPVYKLGQFSGRIGYGYNYANASTSKFSSEKPLSELLNNWDSTATVKGVYLPYFTPTSMITNSLLAQLDYQLTDHFSVKISGKYGFLSTAMNPYLFVDQDTNNTIFVQRAFQSTNFTPLELSIKLWWQINGNWSTEAEYLHVENFFYQADNFNWRIKTIF